MPNLFDFFPTRGLLAFVTAVHERPKWPWGRRATIDDDGAIALLADDAPVEYWVCCRLDEPWTWSVMTHQFTGACVSCATAVIYRVSDASPTDPAVKKLCRRCAEALVGADA